MEIVREKKYFLRLFVAIICGNYLLGIWRGFLVNGRVSGEYGERFCRRIETVGEKKYLLELFVAITCGNYLLQLFVAILQSFEWVDGRVF